MDLCKCRGGRGVEEAFALIVEDVFAVVGCVNKSGGNTEAVETSDNAVEQIVGI